MAVLSLSSISIVYAGTAVPIFKHLQAYSVRSEEFPRHHYERRICLRRISLREADRSPPPPTPLTPVPIISLGTYISMEIRDRNIVYQSKTNTCSREACVRVCLSSANLLEEDERRRCTYDLMATHIKLFTTLLLRWLFVKEQNTTVWSKLGSIQLTISSVPRLSGRA